MWVMQKGKNHHLSFSGTPVAYCKPSMIVLSKLHSLSRLNKGLIFLIFWV